MDYGQSELHSWYTFFLMNKVIVAPQGKELIMFVASENQNFENLVSVPVNLTFPLILKSFSVAILNVIFKTIN